MYVDQRSGWLESSRFALQAAAYPLQVAVNSPSAAWRSVSQSLSARDSLQTEIQQLRMTNAALAVRAMRVESLEQENARLRSLKAGLPSLVQRWETAQVISSDLSSLRQRFVIDRGTQNEVFKGQAVLNASGVLGQTLRVGPFSAEVILLTDPEHAMPVMVARNELRTLAIGSGSSQTVLLPYLPAQSDVQVGDKLMSSGLGGVFPAGYPVATVTEVRRDGANALAVITAQLAAPVDRGREVAVVWLNPENPAAPGTATELTP
jgi:rod shape-determining protein MreC